ncbi:MAG: hypothetical protein HQL99_15310 [Magnetococcales bacterium]|nr:hypothetical protein [Magnetococcales bacterium]
MKCATRIDPAILPVRQRLRRGRGFMHFVLHRDDVLIAVARCMRWRRFDQPDSRDLVMLNKVKRRILELLGATHGEGVQKSDLLAMLLPHYHHQVVDAAIKSLAESRRILVLANLRVNGRLLPATIHLVEKIDPSIYEE